MKFVGVVDVKEEWLKSELPALEQLYAMGYEYKSQADLIGNCQILSKLWGKPADGLNIR